MHIIVFLFCFFFFFCLFFFFFFKQKTAYEMLRSLVGSEMCYKRQERMAQRVSQATLAYGIGVSDGFISQVESPKNPSKYNLNHINEIARFLGCSPRKFLPEEPL